MKYTTSLVLVLAIICLTMISSRHIPLKVKKPTEQEFHIRSALVETLSKTTGYLPFKHGRIPLDQTTIGNIIPMVNFLDTQFFGELDFGNPGQALEIMFDTGSSNTFVLAPNCTVVTCLYRTLFNYTESSSFYLNGTSIILSYGDGDFYGFLGNDNINLGDSVVSQMLLALIYNPESFAYLYARFDGLAGMAYPSASVNQLPAFFEVLVEQGLVDEASFSFYLTKDLNQNGSALVLGGVDERYANSSFHYVNLTHDSYYMTDLDDLIIGNKSYIPNKMNIVLDSGTSIIVGPEEIMKDIIKLYPHQIMCEDVDSYPNLVFVIGGVRYEIPPGLYIVQQFGHCVLGVMAAQFTEELQNTIILGDIFLRTYYTHFDYGNKRLGFALAANVSNITTHSTPTSTTTATFLEGLLDV